MRDIKFRAWHIKQKRFIDINGLFLWFGEHPDKGSVYGITEQGVLKEYDISEIELMQFTGLTDKNGNKIYDGDILKVDDKGFYPEKNALISWVDWKVNNNWMSKRAGWDIKGILQIWTDETIEIIGNIYENPELLG